MLNAANLEPQWFEAILDGTKRTEYRLRRRRDHGLIEPNAAGKFNRLVRARRPGMGFPALCPA
jgi:hypothetical protein